MMQATVPGELPTAESGKDASTALTLFMLKREPDFYGQESKPLDHTLWVQACLSGHSGKAS